MTQNLKIEFFLVLILIFSLIKFWSTCKGFCPLQLNTKLPGKGVLTTLALTMAVVVFLLLCFASAQSLNCGSLYQKPQCTCFTSTNLAVCRSGVNKIPFFGDRLIAKLDYIDLRFNRITTVNNSRKNEFSTVQLDLRKNPIKCDTLPNWDNILSECSMTTQSSISASITMTEATLSYSSSTLSTSRDPTTDTPDMEQSFWINVTVTPALILYCLGTIVYIIKKKCKDYLRRFVRNFDHDLEMQTLLGSSSSTNTR